jgi:ribose 5-phosphate isomerase B
MKNLKVAIGCDHAGFELKEKIVEYLALKGYDYKDFGTYSVESCDYPKVAKTVAKAVADKSFERGILVCGSGIGVSIAANKVRGIRAALCWNMFTAKSSRSHNDSNILCLGQRVTEIDLAIDIVDTWLNTEFEGGRHKVRVDMIEE